MCGHACISLGRYAVDYQVVKPVSPETRVNIQCPCGLVTLYVQYDAKTRQSGSVRFESIPCYAYAVDKTVKVGKRSVEILLNWLITSCLFHFLFHFLFHVLFHFLWMCLCPCPDGLGEVRYDLGYGGAFYALVDVHQLKMDFDTTPVRQLEQAGTSIAQAIRYDLPC